MGKKDRRVDAYIDKSARFAQPILRHIRKVVHSGCPDVEETMKWSFPHFTYKGRLCSMAAFKAHCAFGFSKGALLAAESNGLKKMDDTAMGQFGRITSIADLPDEKMLVRLVRKASALNDAGVKVPKRPAKPKGKIVVPDYLLAALKQNKKALATFEGFSDSHRREYVEWITDAKGEDTRTRRLDTAVAWMGEGKVRNWKYVR